MGVRYFTHILQILFLYVILFKNELNMNVQPLKKKSAEIKTMIIIIIIIIIIIMSIVITLF